MNVLIFSRLAAMPFEVFDLSQWATFALLQSGTLLDAQWVVGGLATAVAAVAGAYAASLRSQLEHERQRNQRTTDRLDRLRAEMDTRYESNQTLYRELLERLFSAVEVLKSLQEYLDRHREVDSEFRQDVKVTLRQVREVIDRIEGRQPPPP